MGEPTPEQLEALEKFKATKDFKPATKVGGGRPFTQTVEMKPFTVKKSAGQPSSRSGFAKGDVTRQDLNDG